MASEDWELFNKEARDRRVLRMEFGVFIHKPICEVDRSYLHFLKLSSIWKTLTKGQKCCITQSLNNFDAYYRRQRINSPIDKSFEEIVKKDILEYEDVLKYGSLDFGKYANICLTNVPDGYLSWVYFNVKKLKPDLKKKLQERLKIQNV